MGVVIFDLSVCFPDGEGMRKRCPLMSSDQVTATKGKLGINFNHHNNKQCYDYELQILL